MPTFAQGSRSNLAYAVESTFGTAPASGYIALPFTSHSLNLTKDLVAGTDIQSDRMPRHERHGNKQIGGDIVGDLRKEDYDVLIESAMLNSWTEAGASGRAGDVIKVGTTAKYLTFEDYSADIDQVRLFSGCSVSSMAMSIAPNQMIATTFSMVGSGMTTSAIQQTGVTAASANAPFDSYSGTLAIANQGVTPVASSIVTSIDFTVNNTFAPTFVVGSDVTPALEVGRAEVTGSFSAYFQDMDLIILLPTY